MLPHLCGAPRSRSFSTTLALLTDDVVVKTKVEAAIREPTDQRCQEPEHTLAVLRRPRHIAGPGFSSNRTSAMGYICGSWIERIWG